MVLKVTAKDVLVSSDPIARSQAKRALDLVLRPHMAKKRATGSMDLAWLLRDVSSKPESHARERDAVETTQGEGQQRCSPSQVEAGWA